MVSWLPSITSILPIIISDWIGLKIWSTLPMLGRWALAAYLFCSRGKMPGQPSNGLLHKLDIGGATAQYTNRKAHDYHQRCSPLLGNGRGIQPREGSLSMLQRTPTKTWCPPSTTTQYSAIAAPGDPRTGKHRKLLDSCSNKLRKQIVI